MIDDSHSAVFASGLEPNTRFPLPVLLVPFAFLLSACGDNPVDVEGPPAEVRLAGDLFRLDVFEELQLAAVVRDTEGRRLGQVAVQWSVADTSVAKISPEGVLTGAGIGSSIVVASTGQISDTAALVVSSPPVGEIVISEETILLGEQGVTRLEAHVLDAEGRAIPNAEVSWSSADDDVVSIDPEGEAQGRAVGETVLTVRSEGAEREVGARVTTGWKLIQPSYYFACALRVDGQAYCWGITSYGRLGAGPAVEYETQPLAVDGGLRFESLTLGEHHACGLTGAGEAWCWGRDYWGTLGQGAATEMCQEEQPCSTVPVRVRGEHTFSALGAGEDHTCGLAVDGRAFCWGSAAYGRLGTPEAADFCSSSTDPNCSKTPIPVHGESRFASLTDGGTAHTCALTDGGDAYCWGRRSYLGTTADHEQCEDEFCAVPMPVSGGESFAQLRTGFTSTCGLASDGRVLCWDPAHDDPTALPLSSTVSFLGPASVGWVMCGLTDSGENLCWELGSPSWPPQIQPLEHGLPLRWVASSAPSSFAGTVCAVDERNLGYCWTDGWPPAGPELLELP